MKSLFPETLTQEDVKKFLTPGDETLILAVREHSIPLLLRILQLGIAETLFTVGATIAAYVISHDIIFSIAVLLTLGLISGGLAIRELVHWYFHLYLITTKKILEVRYNPLFSELSSSVLLDQVRCTEIDAEMHGFISEILDLGNVRITFDRPTHQEEFVLKNIRSPRKIANHLSTHLYSSMKQEVDINQEVWFKNLHTDKYQFTEPTTYGSIN
ncbi:MAG: hypothetical protein ACHQT7_00020 [Candidatus Levyibacteriota bacterium]